jgi:hypothetical protein
MSRLGLWNPDKELNKAERSNLSRLWAGHGRPEPLKSGL